MNLILREFLLFMYLSPKHLKLFAGGMPSGAFVHNADEGYRTLVPIKTSKLNPPKTPIRQGGAGKAKA